MKNVNETSSKCDYEVENCVKSRIELRQMDDTGHHLDLIVLYKLSSWQAVALFVQSLFFDAINGLLGIVASG